MWFQWKAGHEDLSDLTKMAKCEEVNWKFLDASISIGSGYRCLRSLEYLTMRKATECKFFSLEASLLVLDAILPVKKRSDWEMLIQLCIPLALSMESF